MIWPAMITIFYTKSFVWPHDVYVGTNRSIQSQTIFVNLDKDKKNGLRYDKVSKSIYERYAKHTKHGARAHGMYVLR